MACAGVVFCDGAGDVKVVSVVLEFVPKPSRVKAEILRVASLSELAEAVNSAVNAPIDGEVALVKTASGLEVRSWAEIRGSVKRPKAKKSVKRVAELVQSAEGAE